ncbi:MAG: amidoligase family protein [Balneolaceae bacterium]
MEVIFKKPPVSETVSGQERRVGLEFEFTGLPMDRAAEMISGLYGGTAEQISTYKFKVSGTEFGDFALELDASLLKDKKYEKTLKSLGIKMADFKNKEKIEETLMDVASSVVPFEIITPPIYFSSLHRLTSMVDRLREWKAKGTGSSVFYAFGMHINPEIPRMDTDTLLRHLQAFVLLEKLIRKWVKVNMSRRMTPYINEYQEEYVRLILDPAYEPDLEMLIEDYVAYNSRNRALDMLPVFMYLNEELTQSLLTEDITSSRPTFHYRLPNCSIEDENWSLALEWNRWWLVEKLASDQKTLQQYSKAWLKMKKNTLVGFESKWLKLMERWAKNVQ